MEGMFINELIHFMGDMSSSTALTKLLLIIIISLLVTIYKFFKPKVVEILNTIRYFSNYLTAVDSALEHSLKNGYSNARDKKLEQLNEKDKITDRK
jgi:hypothetical protein